MKLAPSPASTMWWTAAGCRKARPQWALAYQLQLVSLAAGRVACLGNPVVPGPPRRLRADRHGRVCVDRRPEMPVAITQVRRVNGAADAVNLAPIASLQARAVVSPGQARHGASRVGSSIAPRALIFSAPMRQVANAWRCQLKREMAELGPQRSSFQSSANALFYMRAL